MATLTRADRATHPTVLRRSAIVAAGTAVALAGWVLANAAVTDLRQPSFGTAPAQSLGAGMVLFASLVAGLVGWASLVAIERLSHRGASLWVGIATTAALLSLAGPLSGAGVTTGNRVSVALLHAAVALVVIPLMSRTSDQRHVTQSGNR